MCLSRVSFVRIFFQYEMVGILEGVWRLVRKGAETFLSLFLIVSLMI